MREKNDVHFILSQYFFFPTTTTIWRKTEKTKEVFINRSQQGGQKRGAFFEKKQRRASTLSSLNLMKELSKASVIAPWRQLLRLFLRPLFVS
tara:strand:- start:84 stop:359 length:276 start_codon:yes stop_codon:yes gene_type:complete